MLLLLHKWTFKQEIVLGFRLVELGDDGRIEHLPLLYKPGPTPGRFTRIIIANFTATSDTTPTETAVKLSPGGPPLSELVLKIIFIVVN